MNPFTPYNLNISKKEVSSCTFLVSLVLEAPSEPNGKLYDIIVSDVLFEPVPKEITKMALVMTINDIEPK
jgi:hypothetical protein